MPSIGEVAHTNELTAAAGEESDVRFEPLRFNIESSAESCTLAYLVITKNRDSHFRLRVTIARFLTSDEWLRVACMARSRVAYGDLATASDALAEAEA